jgi:hypothetical protein
MQGVSGEFQEVPYGAEGATRWLHESRDSLNRYTIYTTDQHGKTQAAAFVDHDSSGFDPKLVAHSSQMVTQRYRQSELPKWLGELVYRYDWLRNWWLKQSHQELVVYDYEMGKVLWRMKTNDEQHTSTTVTPTGSFLIIEQLIDDQYEVTVLALPVALWSVWWSRGIGIILGLGMMWYLFHRKHRVRWQALGRADTLKRELQHMEMPTSDDTGTSSVGPHGGA